MIQRTLLCVVCAISIASCEITPGVTRTASIRRLPSPDCLVGAVRAVDGVSQVMYVTEEIPTSWLFPQWRADTVHLITYVYAGIQNELRFRETANGGVTFSHGYNRASQDVVDALYPIWLQLEASLQNRCGISDLGPEVTQTCLGVECPQAWPPGRVLSDYLDALAAGGYSRAVPLIHPDELEKAKRRILDAIDRQAPLSFWAMPPLKVEVPILDAPVAALAAMDAAELVRSVLEQQPEQRRLNDSAVLGGSTMGDSLGFFVATEYLGRDRAVEPGRLEIITVKPRGDEWMIADIATLESMLRERIGDDEQDAVTEKKREELRDRLREILQEPGQTNSGP